MGPNRPRVIVGIEPTSLGLERLLPANQVRAGVQRTPYAYQAKELVMDEVFDRYMDMVFL